jgi:hypothetical protein
MKIAVIENFSWPDELRSAATKTSSIIKISKFPLSSKSIVGGLKAKSEDKNIIDLLNSLANIKI